MENSSSQQAKEKEVADGWVRKLSNLFSIILMLQIAAFAIIAISEIAARESVLSMLTGRIATLKSEFVERNRTVIDVPAETSSTDKSISFSNNNSLNRVWEDRDKLLSDIESYELLKRSLIFLIAQGSSDPELSLNTIQRAELYEIIKGIRRDKENKSLRNDAKFEDSSESHVQFPDFISSFYELILRFSSDKLLAIAIMACAAIGAMIAALRGNGLMTLRALSLGVATGFVVYLAIKGGRHVFLLQMQGEIVAFNPYGSAFAGLLAGLFTEKAYQVLTTIVDEFADRLRAASSGKKSGD